MPLDTEVADLLKAGLIAGATSSGQLIQTIDKNLTQGLGVVNTTLIQTHGGTADDAATMAALRTAIHIPQKPSGDS